MEKFRYGDICKVGFAAYLRGYNENDLVQVIECDYHNHIDRVWVKPYGSHPTKAETDKDYFFDFELSLVSRTSEFNFISEKATSRKELIGRLGKSDRAMRKEVADLAEKIGVISLSKVGGYRLVDKTLESSEEIAKEIEIVQHQINEHQSRIDHLNMRTSRLIADLKVLQEQQMDLVAKGK